MALPCSEAAVQVRRTALPVASALGNNAERLSKAPTSCGVTTYSRIVDSAWSIPEASSITRSPGVTRSGMSIRSRSRVMVSFVRLLQRHRRVRPRPSTSGRQPRRSPRVRPSLPSSSAKKSSNSRAGRSPVSGSASGCHWATQGSSSVYAREKRHEALLTSPVLIRSSTALLASANASVAWSQPGPADYGARIPRPRCSGTKTNRSFGTSSLPRSRQ